MKVWKKLRHRIKGPYYRRISNKRKYPRVPLSVKVTNLNSGNFTYYQAGNISVGGMFLKAAEPFEPGTPLNLMISLPDKREIELAATVVRVQDEDEDLGFHAGMGISFNEVSEEVEEAIENFVGKRV